MRIGDVATVCRTKNAGAFLLTVDLVFDNREHYSLVADGLSAGQIAALYHVPTKTVRIFYWEELHAIKITLPRWISAGRPGDRDIYGCQQHAPVLTLEI
jgi:hypothetical protein